MSNNFDALKFEVQDFYRNKHFSLYKKNKEYALSVLDEKIGECKSSYIQKGKQYEVLAELYEPVLFENTAMFFELCSVPPTSMPETAGNWTYIKNKDAYRNCVKEFLAERDWCNSFPVYMYIGEFGDEMHHFAFNSEPIFIGGFKSLYDRAEEILKNADAEQSEWLYNMQKGLLAIKRLAERFSEKAMDLSEKASDLDKKMHYNRIAEMASHTPWNKPRSFEEALCTVSFIQNTIPSLEGGRLNSMGRLDCLLYPFYKSDINRGALTEAEAYRMICEFLIVWNSHVDEDMADQRDDYGGTVYTLGGYDENGNRVCNELTMMFLKASRENNIIYPKIKCRFDANSPDEYLREIALNFAAGKSTIHLQNDERFIPALLKAGVKQSDANNYSILGCWEPVIPDATNEHCSYISLLKILELSIYNDFNRDDIEAYIIPLEGVSFEKIYNIVVENIKSMLMSRCKIASKARLNWVKTDPHMIFSSAINSCMENKRDITDGGAKYNFDELIFAGLPNVIDSLLVIKELCFEKKICTVDELLDEVRNNWNNEKLHANAKGCSFYGDESEKSISITKRLTDDIAAITENLPVAYNGKTTSGYMLFMEMNRWAKYMRATPDGRRNGDIFARGLTPSVIHKLSSVSAVINTLSAIDTEKVAANSVININVPFKNLSEEGWVAFLRGCAKSSVEALQINCISREELLEAQKNPEKYQNLIVRVCGFSARFTSLAKEVQDDFLMRHFFD